MAPANACIWLLVSGVVTRACALAGYDLDGYERAPVNTGGAPSAPQIPEPGGAGQASGPDSQSERPNDVNLAGARGLSGPLAASTFGVGGAQGTESSGTGT